MKDLTDYGNEYWSYDDLINSMEVERLVEVTDDDYQGDTRALVRKDGSYGFLMFGWGSCSGCDALQAVESDLAEATKLRDKLYAEIHWESDAAAMAAFLRDKDWALTFDDTAETQQFVREALAALT